MIFHPLLCFKISLAYIIILWIQRYAMFEIYLTDSQTLNGHCEQERLLSYEDIHTHGDKEQVVELLKDGESARISGFARFSRFVSFYGCFNASGLHAVGVTKYELSSETKLFNCISNCSVHKVSMIGVSYEWCYCFNNNTLPLERKLNKSSCDQTHMALFDNNFRDFNRSKLIVYSFKSKHVNINTSFLAKHSFKQCQFVMKTVNVSNKASPVTYIEQPCSTKGNVKGFICMINPSHEQCHEINESLVKPGNDSKVFCVVHQSLDLPKAETYCSSKKGKLSHKSISINAAKALAENLKNNSVYLFNTFREFLIDERTQSQSKDDQCISLRKSERSLLVETVDCGMDIPALCYRIMNITQKNVTDIVRPVPSPEFGDGNPIRTIIIGVSLGCVILVAIIALLVVKHVIKGSESKSQPSGDACKSDTPYSDPLFQVNDNKERVSSESGVPGNIQKHIEEVNQLYASGTDTSYDEIERHEDIVLYSGEGSNQHTSGNDQNYDFVERNYDIIGNTNNKNSNRFRHHSNIYNITSENSSHYDKLGQHVKNTKSGGKDSNIYNHVTSGDEN